MFGGIHVDGIRVGGTCWWYMLVVHVWWYTCLVVYMLVVYMFGGIHVGGIHVGGTRGVT